MNVKLLSHRIDQQLFGCTLGIFAGQVALDQKRAG